MTGNLLVLSDFDHLRNNSNVKFKKELVDGVSYTIISYMVSDNDFWNEHLSFETRGITFETDSGKCVCRPFCKFFNINEREDTRLEIVRDNIVDIFDKRDGSLVTPVLVNGFIRWKSKKSFKSSAAKLADICSTEQIKDMCELCLNFNYTPIFELTHPEAQIVLNYGEEPNLTLLAIRDIDSGDYVLWDQVVLLAEMFNVPIIKKYQQMSWDRLFESCHYDRGIEGYVLVLSDGRRVKLKTEWYVQCHGLSTEIRERDVAEFVVNEKIDDLKSTLVSHGYNLEHIEIIEKRVVEEISSLYYQVKDVVDKMANKSIKDVAIELKNHHLFKLIMSEIRGKETDYNKYWKDNYLKNYSLRSVYNINF